MHLREDGNVDGPLGKLELWVVDDGGHDVVVHGEAIRDAVVNEAKHRVGVGR